MVKKCKLCGQTLKFFREKLTRFCDDCAIKAKEQGILNTFFGKEKKSEEQKIKSDVKKHEGLINKVLKNKKLNKKVLKKMRKLGLTKEQLEEFTKEMNIK